MTSRGKNEIAALVDETMREFADAPVDLLNLNQPDRELNYLLNHRESYIKTITDIVNRHPPDSQFQVLEIGSFLGVLCICLAKLGYQVTATDIPEYISNQNLKAKFDHYHIAFDASNLRDYALPYQNDSFDTVIMCQVLEHLNFNPLPVVQEINRILKPGGLFYLSLPNLASLDNRLRLIRGQSIHPSIQDYLAQLDPNQNMIVGLHWREYTALEIRQMLEYQGFRIHEQYFDCESSDAWNVSAAAARVKNRRIDLVLLFKALRFVWRLVGTKIKTTVSTWLPGLRGNHTTLAIKVANCPAAFHFTDATRPPQ